MDPIGYTYRKSMERVSILGLKPTDPMGHPSTILFLYQINHQEKPDGYFQFLPVGDQFFFRIFPMIYIYSIYVGMIS